MTSKIVAIQGDHPSKLNPSTDTSIFLANEIQDKKYKIFYYQPQDLSILNSKVVAKGFFIKINSVLIESNHFRSSWTRRRLLRKAG